MSKLLKSLIIGSVLSTITPINFSSIGFSSSNINDNINDEEEIKIENKDTKYDDVFAYAEKRGINLKTLRTDDTSGMLGPKYNGGSWKEATDLVYKLKIENKDFKDTKEAAEVRKCMATIIEHVSIGKKLDFSNGHRQMVEAIVAYMNTEDKNVKNKIRNRGTDEAIGVKYIAAAVAQEMLINLHKGMFLCALKENYEDACSKVDEALNTWVQKQLNTENVSLGKEDICQKYDSFSKLKPDERSKQIEFLVDYVRSTVFDANLSRFDEKFTRPSSVESSLQKYLRNCTIKGMNKLLNDDSIKSDNTSFYINIDLSLKDTIKFYNKIDSVLALAAKVSDNCDKLLSSRAEAYEVCLNAIKNKENKSDNPGETQYEFNVDETDKLNECEKYLPFIKVKPSDTQKFKESNQYNPHQPMRNFSKFLAASERSGPVKSELGTPFRELVEMMALKEELLESSLFDSPRVIKYQRIFERFSNSTLQELNKLCNEAYWGKNWDDWWQTLEKNVLENNLRRMHDLAEMTKLLASKIKDMSGLLKIISDALKSDVMRKLVEKDDALKNTQINLSKEPTLGEIKTVILENKIFDKIIDVCTVERHESYHKVLRDARAYMESLYENPANEASGFLSDLPFVRTNETRIYAEKYQFTAEELNMLEQFPFKSAFEQIKKFYIGKLLKSCCTHNCVRNNGNFTPDARAVFGINNLNNSPSSRQEILEDWQKYIVNFQDHFLEYLKTLSWEYSYNGNLQRYSNYKLGSEFNNTRSVCWLEHVQWMEHENQNDSNNYLQLACTERIDDYVPSVDYYSDLTDLKEDVEQKYFPQDKGFSIIRDVNVSGQVLFSSDSSETVHQYYRFLAVEKPKGKEVK